MTDIKLKRVYEPAEVSDGFRVFVDKLWSRGMKKNMLKYDLWAKNIAPSSQLRKWYHDNPEQNWKEFGERYIKELEKSEYMKQFISEIIDKPVVTLLYASRNTLQNHAVILSRYIRKSL